MRPAVPATHSSASCSARPRRRVPSIVELEAAVTLIERISSGLSSAIQLGISDSTGCVGRRQPNAAWSRLLFEFGGLIDEMDRDGPRYPEINRRAERGMIHYSVWTNRSFHSTDGMHVHTGHGMHLSLCMHTPQNSFAFAVGGGAPPARHLN